MNERLRMEYLDAMGISMFVPRRILPGARASMQAVLPQTQNSEVDPPAAPTLAESPVQQKQEASAEPRQIHTAVDDIMESFSRPAARTDVLPEPEPAPKSPAVVNEPPVQFALSIWRPTPALMILDTRHAGGALPTQALLENILRAKGVSLPPNKPDILMWPPGGVAPTPGWDAPREMLQAFLQARLERQPAQYLWLMGESACRAVLADRQFQDSVGMAINLDALASLAVVMPSLADMLQQPSLKARTWAAIRAHHVR